MSANDSACQSEIAVSKFLRFCEGEERDQGYFAMTHFGILGDVFGSTTKKLSCHRTNVVSMHADHAEKETSRGFQR